MYYPFGIPPTTWGMPIYGQPPCTDESVRMAKQILKQYKADKKKKDAEDKEKKDKSKPRLFSVFELGGAIFLFSIPVVMMQLYFLGFVQEKMNQLFNVVPH